MKKILLTIFLLLLAVVISAQGLRVYNQDLRINKASPVLDLHGLGASLNFNNDLYLTQSANKLTLSGGDLYLDSFGALYIPSGSIGSLMEPVSTINATDIYSSNYYSYLGMSSIGITGSRFLKGWFTDLEVTNLPTVNGATLKSALSLTATDVGLGNVTNESKATMFSAPTFTGTKRPKFNTDSLTTFYDIKQRSGIYNVKDYAAVGDGVTDDTDEIKATIAAASLSTIGATVYFPRGNYLISDSLVISSLFISIKGDGYESQIHSNTTSKSLIRFRNCERFSIKDIAIIGNGGEFGAGGTTGNGIELWNSHYGYFENVHIWYTGGNGIYALNGMWGNRFNSVQIMHNLGDGMNFVNNNMQSNTGQNGNGLSITNSSISRNGGDGIEWASSSINITGCTIEANQESGIQIGSTISTGGAFGANIKGNYFELNVLGQILFQADQTSYKSVQGVTIDGNYLYSSLTSGATALIMGDVNGTYSGAIKNTIIGANYYTYTGGYITDYVNFENMTTGDVVIYCRTVSDLSLASGNLATIVNKGQSDLSPQYTSVTTTQITAAQLVPIIYADLSGNTTLSSNPPIDAGYDNQIITILNYDPTYTLTLVDHANLQLSNDESCVLTKNESITLRYSTANAYWYEISRSNTFMAVSEIINDSLDARIGGGTSVTDVGEAFITLANPGAVTFPQINADNTVSALSASDFQTAIGTSEIVNDTIEARLAAASIGLTVRDTTGGSSGSNIVATPDFVESLIGSGGGGVITKQTIQFRVDDTGAPAAGDSIFVDSRIQGKALDVYKAGLKQSRRFTATNTRVGYRVNTDTITVNPVFAAGNDWIIDINDPVTQTFLSLAGEESTLLDSLMLYYKLDESSGTTADDAMNIQDAEIRGSASRVSGKLGNAVHTNTSNKFIRVPYNTNAKIDTVFSVSMWFYLDTLPSVAGQSYLFYSFLPTSPYYTTALILENTNNLRFVVRNEAGTAYAVSSSAGSVQDSTWYNVVATFRGNGNTSQIYLNGADVSTNAASFVGGVYNSTNYFYFGNNDSELYNTASTIDEIALWNRVVTAGEVTTLYNSGTGKTHPFTE